jgi:HK97 family phage prohead protease
MTTVSRGEVFQYAEASEFDSIEGQERSYQVEIRVQTPFRVDKDAYEDDKYEMDDTDVMIRGPVYVGNAEMQDRHGELVAMDAIMSAWNGYSQNPVILYNHSKSHGVIGRMVDVEMGEFAGMDEQVPIGRAIIDGGEKDIVRKIRKGMLKAFSIGFIARAAVKECKDEDTCYMTFTEIDWLETSVVDVPASPNALFNVEKHIIGYEDMGDRIAILFDKIMEDGPSEEPPAGGDMESPVEESVGGCGCGESTCADLEDESSAIDLDKSEISEMERFFGSLNERLNAIEAKIDSQSSESEMTDSFNTPVGKSLGQQPERIEMSDDNLIPAESADEDIVVPVEEVQIKSEEVPETVLKTEATEEVLEEAEAEEEVLEEAEAEAEAEEDLPEEVVEEVAEATEEESATDDMTTADVLIAVVKNLSAVDSRLEAIESHIASNEEISELKLALEESNDQIAQLTQAKEAAEAEAEIEAEVAKRVAERMASAGVEAPAIVPTPKSLSNGVSVKKEKSLITRHDPTPSVSQGMNGLADWLSSQISGRHE